MGKHVKRIAVVAMVLLFAAASAAGLLAQSAMDAPLAACDLAAAAPGSEPLLATEPALAAQLPPGLALAVLADEATEAWPPFARGLVMTVRHLTLDAGVTSATRQSQGPILFLVETGAIGVSINGRPQVYDQGTVLLVERSENYQLRNDDPVNPATVLRVQVVPPGSETKVARGDIAVVTDDEQALAPGPPFLLSQLLLSAELPTVEGLTHLVLGCLSWADETADAGDAAHAGPMALFVLRGELLVGESGALTAGQCTVFQRNVAHRLRAGSPPPLVLMIGLLPDGAPFWAEPAETDQTTGRLTFSCDPDVEPDAIPDAAQTPPFGSAMRAQV